MEAKIKLRLFTYQSELKKLQHANFPEPKDLVKWEQKRTIYKKNRKSTFFGDHIDLGMNESWFQPLARVTFLL